MAERLSRWVAEIAAEMRDGFIETEIMGFLGKGQQSRLEKLGEDLANQLAPLFELQDEVVSIRQTLGVANEQTGISADLSRLDMLNKRLCFLDKIIEGQNSDKVLVNELPSLPVRVKDGDRYYVKQQTFGVRIMSDNTLQTFEEMLEAFRTGSYAVADRIADKNRETLEITLS